MGRLHARVVRDLGLELAIVEPDPQLRAELASSFDCPLAADLGELDGPIDAASISTPDDLRLPVVEPLLAAGTALLIEKPLATSATLPCSREKIWTMREVSRHAEACSR